ncbi:MAG: helix-turn-helix domain-containing protein [Pseudonocardia sp.]|nr:helix-turn-helix domain-containing protein [Pseudonocardia sp.]
MTAVSDRPARLITTGQAARELGIDPATLWRWVKAEYVTPHSKTVGGHLRWDLEDLRGQIKRLQARDE